MQALKHIHSRLCMPLLEACAQQPLIMPCRMLATTRSAAVGRWDSMWELYEDLPHQDSKAAAKSEGEAGSEGKPQDSPEAADGLEGREATSQAEGLQPRVEDSGGPKQLTENDLSEAEKAQFEVDKKAALDDLYQHIEGKYFPEEEINNLAGPGRPAWARLAYDEKSEEGLWELDLTGGRVPDNEKNAHLCREAKEVMLEMHESGCSIEHIADFFRVRRQRVMAILALFKIDRDREAAGKPMFEEFANVMEGGSGKDGTGLDGDIGYFDCDEIVGSGERHVKILPRSPGFEAKLRAQNPNFSWEETEDSIARAEEEQLVEEFTERLLYNMGELGSTIQRNVNRSHRPKRPEKGFGLLVKPLGGAAGENYVADRTGKTRPLTKDESFLQHRRRTRPRRKLYD